MAHSCISMDPDRVCVHEVELSPQECNHLSSWQRMWPTQNVDGQSSYEASTNNEIVFDRHEMYASPNKN